MKYITLALGFLAAVASARPAEQRDEQVQTVHLTFHGGPANYEMAFPADGEVYQTNNDIAVSVIEAPDYSAYYNCQFQTEGEVTLASSISPEGVNQILVGPPQPVTAVSCQGYCVPTYADCFRDNMYVGRCCSGYCAANKCRPWVPPY